VEPRRWKFTFRVVSLLVILAAGLLTLATFWEYQQTPTVLPENSQWGVVHVGGLTLDQAQQRVLAVYLSPFELRYQGQIIHTPAEALGFSVIFLDGAQPQPKQCNFNSFWAYLWNDPQPVIEREIRFSLDESQLRAYLQSEIANRYDVIPVPPFPIPASSRFSAGVSGRFLDIEASLVRFRAALSNPLERQVDLIVQEQPMDWVDASLLKAVLMDELRKANFNGTAEIYAYHLSKDQQVHFAVANGKEVPTEIAFSAASTIKIPILLTVLMQVQPPFPDEFMRLSERMMVYSENPPADRIMEVYLGSTLAPLKVTEMLQKAGFQNTFLAGYFYLGAPLLQRFDTPANQRLDVNINPDVYNQTTAGEMGRLLKEIYQCAVSEKGVFVETFPEEINAEKCDYLMETMKRNRIGVLGEAGLPEGVPFAHKHGWTEESDGFLHTISDAGIVFGPQSDYVMVIFLYDPAQLLFEPANALTARLSQRIFNAWNPDYQIEWNFGEIRYR